MFTYLLEAQESNALFDELDLVHWVFTTNG